MDESLRAGIYVRVSRKEQASDEHFSIPAQLRETRKFIETRAGSSSNVYIDKGYTGRNDRRPQFRRMMADVKAGRIQVVVVHKLDRFSRSIFDILKYWKVLQEEYSASFASATERFDFTTPEGKLQFHIMAAFAQWYSENLSRETIKGKKERALSGKYNGVLPFGYVKDERGEAVIEPNEAEGVRIAFEAYATGNYSDGQVADLLNRHHYITRHNRQWTKDSVRDFLPERLLHRPDQVLRRSASRQPRGGRHPGAVRQVPARAPVAPHLPALARAQAAHLFAEYDPPLCRLRPQAPRPELVELSLLPRNVPRSQTALSPDR